MVIEQSELEVLLVKNINRKSVYEHLLAVCNNSFYFRMAKYENPTADEYQRITVINVRAKTTEEFRRIGPGGVIGSIRLLTEGVNDVNTLIQFVHKDAGNNDPVVSPESWQIFIQIVEEYFSKIKDAQSLNIDQTRPRRKSGRPNFEEDKWAWNEVNTRKRSAKEVFKEWLAKIKQNPSRTNMVDPDRHFKRIIKPEWGNKS